MREGLGQFLCADADPATMTDRANQICNLSALNANAADNVMDGKGDVVHAVAPIT